MAGKRTPKLALKASPVAASNGAARTKCGAAMVDLVPSLMQVFRSHGQLLLLTGDKSIGKTFVLRHMAAQNPVVKDDVNGKVMLHELEWTPEAAPIVVYVNMRKLGASTVAAHVAKGVDDALIARETLLQKLKRAIPCTTVEVAAKVLAPAYAKTASDARILSDASTPTLEHSLERLVGVAKTAPVTLILDEANEGISTDPNFSEETKRSLSAVVAATKEPGDKGINVILATSTFAYPFGLQRILNFKVTNFRSVINAGDVPPADMKRLLMEEWNMGPHLCSAFLAAYGGNIYLAKNALDDLCWKGPAMCPADATLVGVDSSIAQCLNMEGGVADALIRIARNGIAPIKDAMDPVAKTLSKHDVAPVVWRHGVSCGVSRAAWNSVDTKYGLVAAPHVRLLILEALAAVPNKVRVGWRPHVVALFVRAHEYMHASCRSGVHRCLAR